ncbi:trypsin-like peptidase domain-containing protein [Nocardiopsis sp. CNT-189]|uniref:VMAP-C domain-containing protein n=1 Tax=Nocardiopsis oceanisediminis TaxID=2816862 RepID=UPI003B38E111
MRIPAVDGTVAGGGVALPGGAILTCAHVVDAALLRPRGAGAPADGTALEVDVPGPCGFTRRTAHLIGEAWDAAGDTALLRLAPGAGADPEPARLLTRMSRIERTGRPLPVRIRGHPALLGDQAPHGLVAAARVVGYGVFEGAAQLNLAPDQPVRITQGFSGCGVRADDDGGVVGIVRSSLFGAGPGADGLLAAMTPVESIPSISHLVADAELAEAESFLGRTPFAGVLPAYRSATRERPLEPVGFRTALEAFDHLRELAPGPDGLPPEVVFTEEVAKLRPAARGPLRGYADSRGPEEVPGEALRRLRARPASRPPAAARLEIVAEPLPGGRGPRYELRSRLRAGGSSTPARTVRVGEAELPGEALEIIREAEALLARGTYPPPVPMTLDFYLPLPLLLSGGIARWRVRTPASPHGERLGSAYRIVLHSYERSFAPHWSGARLRMRRRLEQAARRGAGMVRGLPPAAPPGRAHDALADPRIAVCAVGAGADGAGAAHALIAALEAGVPTLVWRTARPGAGPGRAGAGREGSRERRGGGGGKEPLLPWNGPPIFDKLFYRGDLSLSVAEIGDLPRRLHEWRIDSTDTDISDPMHTGHDDPFDIALLTDHAAPPTAARRPAPAGSDVIPPPRAGRSGPAPAAPPPRRAPLPGAAPISAPDELLDSE